MDFLVFLRGSGVEGVGCPLFAELTATQFRNRLRRYLTLLQVDNASLFTLKGFRSGKASAMVAAGCSLKEAMAAGEWRSGAIASYLNEEVIDATRLLQCIEDDDDDELEG